MTETVANPEAASPDLSTLLDRWVEEPPPSLSLALAEWEVTPEALEDYTRSGIPTEVVESLRKVLVQGAASGNPEDAALLARLTPLLDPRERAWDRVVRARNSGEVLTATVIEATKGGVVVDLGVRGFVPSSQIGLNVPRNLTQFVGREIRLRVLDVDRRRQTVILSNRNIMEEERAEKRKSALSRLEESAVRAGTVRRLTEIGAFVDVGGIDGLLHVSEISWKRIDHPSEVLKVGQKVQVKILRLDPSSGRVSLSMRRLTADPWEEARRKYAIGTTVRVKIGKLVPQGAEVEMDEGLEGFLPISEMAGRRITGPEEVVQPGKEVDAQVIDFRPRERRIIFSLRKLEQKKDRQEVESHQRKTTRTSDRTTLGDLFGHLFEEYRQAEEEQAAPAAVAVPPADGEVAASEAPGLAAEVPGTDVISEVVAPAETPVNEPAAALPNEAAAAERATVRAPRRRSRKASTEPAADPMAAAGVVENSEA